MFCVPGSNESYPAALKVAEAAGYNSILTIYDDINGIDSDLFRLNRVPIHTEYPPPFYSKFDPYKRLPGNGDALEVQAIALDWKWLFIYPQQNVATVNRLVIPVGRPVHIDLTSDTVMQSLMIPQLAGQIYAMAGMRTQLNLRADRPGAYFGENTQYNGDGFHEQNFVTDAVPAAAFQAWAKKAAQGNLTLDDARYDILSRQSTLPRPLAFSSVSPGLFQQIVDKYHGHAPQAAPRREASRQ